MAERFDAKPAEAPVLVQTIGGASLILFLKFLKSEQPQSIALRIGRYPEAPDDDAFLVGTLRLNKKQVFSDWRTVMPRVWLANELAAFGDMMTDISVGDLFVKSVNDLNLPVIAARADYIEKLRAIEAAR
jgi:hypothetical protein